MNHFTYTGLARLFFFLSPLLVFFFSAACLANDAPQSSEPTAKWQETTLKNQTMERVSENFMIISGKKYIFRGTTKFIVTLDKNGDGRKETSFISPREIPLPYNCDIIFKQYIVTDEASPYGDGLPVLSEVDLHQ